MATALRSPMAKSAILIGRLTKMTLYIICLSDLAKTLAKQNSCDDRGSNDEEANQHLDIGHNLYLKPLQNHLFLAPINPNPAQILDLGTGTGVWAIDVADLYPSAIVTGTDLSPIQPTWVPPNVRFEIDDMESEWTYSPDTFDLIHIRGLHGSIARLARPVRTVPPVPKTRRLARAGRVLGAVHQRRGSHPA